MTDNKIIYHSSKSKRALEGRGRSSMRFIARAFAMLIILSLFNGCYGGKNVLESLEKDRLEREARAQEEALVRHDDPQKKTKHKRRRRRAHIREQKRLDALEEQMELEAEFAAEQWWIEKELMALQLSDRQREREDEEVKLWREEQKEKQKELESVSVSKKEPVSPKGPMTLEQRVLNSLGMVYVKGGCFEVGERESANEDVENVDSMECVDDFYVGKHEITTGEFMEFVKETQYITDAERDGGCYLYTGNTWYNTTEWQTRNGYHWRDISFNQDADHPVACVSWDDANEFVKWKSGKHGIQYRLPTEAEWEYAASGGKSREKWSGTNKEGDIGIYAWHFNNSKSRTHPVGQKKPNRLGLFDMSGNVWEWVQDNYDQSENSMEYSQNTLRVIRGGSWYSINGNLSTSKRFKYLKPTYRDFASGFRLGMDGRIKLNNKSALK